MTLNLFVTRHARTGRTIINPTIDLKTIEIELPKPEVLCAQRHQAKTDVANCTGSLVTCGSIKMVELWIKPYQRGNAKYGEVIKDYSLKKKAS